jgi:autotransporter-associated beta strand protein
MVNDLPAVTVETMEFTAFNLFGADWILDGNEVTVTKTIHARFDYDEEIYLWCPIKLGGNVRASVGDDPNYPPWLTLRLLGPLDLNGSNLELFTSSTGAVWVGSTISGQGNITVWSDYTAQRESGFFGFPWFGEGGNTFRGMLRVGKPEDTASSATRVFFNKQEGSVVNDSLVINDGCQVTLIHDEQIDNFASVQIYGSGRLLLNDNLETIGSLTFRDVPWATDSGVVDTGTAGILKPLESITVRTSGNPPLIKGHLALINGLLPIDIGPGPDALLEISANISGDGFNKNGPGTLRLSGHNTPVLSLFVNQGTLEARSDWAFGQALPDSAVHLRGGNLALQSVAIPGKALFVDAPGSHLTAIGQCGWAGPAILNQRLNVLAFDPTFGDQTLEFSGPISGPGELNLPALLLGVGNVRLSGPEANTFTGQLTVNCQRLELAKASGVRAYAGPLVVGGVPGSALREVRWLNAYQNVGATLTVYSNGLVNLNGFNEDFGAVTFNGGRVETGNGQFAIYEPLTVNANDFPAIINGFLGLPPGAPARFTVADGSAEPDLLVNAIVFGAAPQVIKDGPGTMSFTGPNTYSGTTLVNGGILNAGQSSALGDANKGTLVASNATLRFEGIDGMSENIELSGAGLGGTHGALEVLVGGIFNGTINLDGPSTINIAQSAGLAANDQVIGSGPLIKTGPGNLSFGGTVANTYSGDTLVYRGALSLAKPNGTPAVPGHLLIGGAGFYTPATVQHLSGFNVSGSVTVNRGGLWDLNGQSEGFDVAALEGRPPLTLVDGGSVQTGIGILFIPAGGDVVVIPGMTGSSSISGRLAFDPGPHQIIVGLGIPANSPECTVSAVIGQTTGPADLIKQGPGTLLLSGANVYTGRTVVSGGRLQVEGSQQQSLVQVNVGTLAGAGTVGPVVMTANSAVVAPHSGVAVLTCGDLSVGATGAGTLQIELNGPAPGTGYDQLNVHGAVNLSNIKLDPVLNFSSALNDQFTIIQNDGSDAIIGTFLGLPQDGALLISGEHFRISYTGGDGNDVVLTHLSPVGASASVWTNSLGGNWNDPANWNNRTVPGTNGAAIISNGIYRITNNTDVAITEFFYGNPNCTLIGNGNLAMSGLFTWEGGPLSGSGTVTAQGGMDIRSAPNVPNKVLSSKALVNPVQGIWGGDGVISFEQGAVISNVVSGNFDCTGDGTLDNGPGANLVVNAGRFRKMGGTNATRIYVPFENSGTVEVHAGTLSLNGGGLHTGIVDVSQTATLSLGGDHTFTADSRIVGAGNFSSVFGGTLNLAGLVDVRGDQTFSAGTVNITGEYNCRDNLLTITGGRVNFNGTGMIAPAAFNLGVLGVVGGSNNLTISGPMTCSGSSSLSGSGMVVANGGLLISGNNVVLGGRTLVNTASALWTNNGTGFFILTDGAIVSNAPGATFTCVGGGVLGSTGTNRFVNLGAFRSSGDTNETRVDCLFDNSGTVEIASGSVNLTGGGVCVGAMKVAAAASLNLGGGTYNLLPGAILTGDGDLRVSGGTANLAGVLTLGGTHAFSGGTANITGEYNCLGNAVRIAGGTVNFNGTGTIAPAELSVGAFGQLSGTNPVTVSGPLLLTAGALLTGTNSVTANGGLSIMGDVVLSGRTLVNEAEGVVSNADNGTSRLTLNDGAVLANATGAVFDVAFGGSIESGSGANAIINSGLFRKTGGTGVALVTVPLLNTGTLEVRSGSLNFSGNGGYTQTDGVTRLGGGSIASSVPLQILGGLLQGSGLISGDVVNGGVVSPGASPGRIIISGNYTQTDEGSLNIEIAGAEPVTGFDQLVVSNSVTLGGTLNVTLTNGFYPTANSRFPFLVSTNYSGRFAAVNYPSNDVAMALAFTPSNVALQVINTRPVIPPIPRQIVTNFSTFRLAVNATDDDVPAQTLSYALSDPPPDATVDANGLITWRVAQIRTPLGVSFTVLVTDSGSPSLTSSQTFEVVVLDGGPSPVLSLQPGTPGSDAITLMGAGVPGAQYVMQFATNLPRPWFNFSTNVAGAKGLWSVADTEATNSARFYRALPVVPP